ncbi:MAG: hypothetical protein ACK5LC_16005 [Coprobacillaceae bacterium]
MIYDKAKWHWGAKNAPKDIPQVNGGTHIAFFLRWCIEKGFSSKQLKKDFPDEIDAIEMKNNNIDCRKFFVMDMDGVLSSEELNTKGNQFAKAYYHTDKTKFAKQYRFYLEDYDIFVNDLFGKETFDNAYFYVENTEEIYQKVKFIIDKRYQEFLDMKNIK